MHFNSISSTKKGIVISIILISYSLISFYLLDLPENGNSQYVVLGLYITGMFWVLLSGKYQVESPDIKKLFSEGFKAFIVITLFMALYTFIFYRFNPQILENGISESNAIIISQGDKTEMEIKENAEKLRDIFMPMMLSINIIKYIFLGAIISIVSAGFLTPKK